MGEGEPNQFDPRTQLARLVRFRRERLDPAEFPGLSRGRNRWRRALSQEEMATLVGVSTVWYAKLERGEEANYSDDFLDRTAYALRLDEAERLLLYLYAVGREPAADPESRAVVDSGLAAFIQAQRWPSYVSDVAWDVVVCNAKFREWFPWIRYEHNIMRWVFTYQEARQQLHNWDTEWAPLMLAQLRLAQARHPDNTRIGSVIAEILRANPDATRMWDAEPVAYLHPDGDRRQLYRPRRRDLTTVEIIAMSPMRNNDLRAVLLLPG